MFRAVQDDEPDIRAPEPVSATATGSRVQMVRSRSALRIQAVPAHQVANHCVPSSNGHNAHGIGSGKGKERAVDLVVGPSCQIPSPVARSSLSPESTESQSIRPALNNLPGAVDMYGPEAGPSSGGEPDWSRSPSPLTELSSEAESEAEASRPAELGIRGNGLLRANSTIDVRWFLLENLLSR